MSFEYINKYYGITAKRGARVRYTGGGKPRLGTICSAAGAHLKIRLDGEKRATPFHPTWELDLLPTEGGQHG